MVANLKLNISSFEAEAAANLFLSSHAPDRLTAGEPHLDTRAGVWRVPVLLAYPRIGPLGQVGEIAVSGYTAEILSATSREEMLAAAYKLYSQHRELIETPVL